MIVIHDGNAAEFAEILASPLNEGLCGALPRLSQVGGTGYAAAYSDVVDLIPESEYASRYEAMIGKFIRQRYEAQNPVHHNQGRHPLCWAFSLAQHAEAVRAKMGLPYVTLSPESIIGSAGYRDIGWYPEKALEWFASRGMAPQSMTPKYSLDPSTWDKEYQQAALSYVAYETYDLGKKDMWAECMTALLNGDSIYTGYRIFAHAMCAMELQKNGNEYGLYLPNTWRPEDAMLLYGKVKVPSEAYVVRQLTYSR